MQCSTTGNPTHHCNATTPQSDPLLRVLMPQPHGLSLPDTSLGTIERVTAMALSPSLIYIRSVISHRTHRIEMEP